MSGFLRIFGFDGLSHPLYLWLGIFVAALLALELTGRAPGSVVVSTGDILARLRGRHADFTRRIPALLRALGLVLLLVALAGPLRGYNVRKDRRA